jgi:hypothetical protein
LGLEIDGLGRNSVPLVWTSGNVETPIVLSVPDLYAANDEETGFFAESVTADAISDNGLIVGQIEPCRPLDDKAFAEARRYVIVWKVDVVDGEVHVRDMLWHDIGTRPTSSPLKNAIVAFFNLAKCGARLAKLAKSSPVLASHPGDDAAS